MNISTIKQRLIEGNQRFVTDKLNGKLQDSDRRNELISSQQPYAIVLSCADSRVVPELVFDTGLGELFVVRVAGNIANRSSLASIEYAVANCGSKVIVVLGHQNCGAVAAAMKGGDNGYNLNHLLKHIIPALNSVEKEKNVVEVNDVVKKNVKLTAQELIIRSQIIGDVVKNKSVEVISAYYNLDSGKVKFL